MQRDLCCEDLWTDSLSRSRARRYAREQRSGLAASGRRLSLVAAVAAVGTAPGGSLLGAGAAAAQASSGHAFKLQAGSRGPLVAELQRDLHVTSDGIFGPLTTAAVRGFQRSHGLVVDGIVGSATWGALHAGGGVSTASARAAAGGVRTLQRALGISADGVFGPQTEDAVRRFQARHGLSVDGVVGSATWSALGLSSSGPVLRRASTPSASSAGGGPPAALRAAIASADQIATRPYVFGGGHGSFQSWGYDCSGSVSYVLHGAGVLSAPEDSTQLESYGAPGPGRWITVYATSGHAYMTIGGRRFDTSAGSGGGSRWTSTPRSSAGYVVRHPAGL